MIPTTPPTGNISVFENMPITNLNLSGCNGTYNEETDEMEGGLTGELLLMPQPLTLSTFLGTYFTSPH